MQNGSSVGKCTVVHISCTFCTFGANLYTMPSWHLLANFLHWSSVGRSVAGRERLRTCRYRTTRRLSLSLSLFPSRWSNASPLLLSRHNAIPSLPWIDTEIERRSLHGIMLFLTYGRRMNVVGRRREWEGKRRKGRRLRPQRCKRVGAA